SARANWSAVKDRVSSISALRADVVEPGIHGARTRRNRGFIAFLLARFAFPLARLAFRAAGQLLRCAARADLGLQRGELAVHVRAGPGLVQFLLDVVGAAAD